MDYSFDSLIISLTLSGSVTLNVSFRYSLSFFSSICSILSLNSVFTLFAIFVICVSVLTQSSSIIFQSLFTNILSSHIFMLYVFQSGLLFTITVLLFFSAVSVLLFLVDKDSTNFLNFVSSPDHNVQSKRFSYFEVQSTLDANLVSLDKESISEGLLTILSISSFFIILLNNSNKVF
jgi:hypothetical protein